MRISSRASEARSANQPLSLLDLAPGAEAFSCRQGLDLGRAAVRGEGVGDDDQLVDR